VFKNLKTSYEGEIFRWELDPRCRHKQNLEVIFLSGVYTEVLQPQFFQIDPNNLIKVLGDKFRNKSVPTPDIQITSLLRGRRTANVTDRETG
jgi:hypothetical protein